MVRMSHQSSDRARRELAASGPLCLEVIRTMERAFAAEGPDEPDLGVNVVYVTARLKLERLASAEVWQVPAATVSAIRSRLVILASTHDSRRLETELLSFTSWVIRVLDRRKAGRPFAGDVPHRRIGDRPLPRHVGHRPTPQAVAN